MTTDYTKDVREVILKIAKKCKNIVNVETEQNIWLGNPKGKVKVATYFTPDIHFVMNNSKVFIFQLCDSQADKQKEILGDLFSALLASEVKKLYFIVPTERKEEIEQVCKVVMSILHHRFHLPDKDLHEYCVWGVPKGDKQKIEEKIIELAIQDRWGISLS
jgi:hypothetical protein